MIIRYSDPSGLDGVLDDLLGQAQQFVQGSVKSVRIKSALTKDLVLSTPLAPGAQTPGKPKGPSGPSLREKILGFAKPTIVLEHSLSSEPIVWAPYGIPKKTYYEWPMIAGAIVAGLSAYGIWSLIKK